MVIGARPERACFIERHELGSGKYIKKFKNTDEVLNFKTNGKKLSEIYPKMVNVQWWLLIFIAKKLIKKDTVVNENIAFLE